MATARTRRLVVGIATSLLSRGIGLIAPLILIPFALQSIGAERYGLWTAAASLTAIALFADLGLGNGLLTRLTKTYASGDSAGARQLISSAYAMTGAIALALTSLAFVLVPTLNVGGWLDPKATIPTAEANAIVTVCLMAFAVNIPVTMIQRVQYAYQQVAYSNIWSAAASLTSVAAFVILTELHLSAVTAVGGAVLAIPVVGLLNTAVFFLLQRRDLFPKRTPPRWTYAQNLLRLGGLFFLLSVLTSVALNLDPLMISRQLGLQSTAEYSVGWKITSTLGLFVTLVNLPLWPANGEALARGDTDWVRKATLRMTAISSGLVLAFGLLLIGPGRVIVDVWLADSGVRPPTSLMLALVFWNLLLAATSPAIMVQNSVGLLRPQLVAWTIFLVLVVPLKWIAIGTFGISGGPWMATVLYAIVVIPMVARGMQKALLAAARRRDQGLLEVEAPPMLRGGASP